MKPNKDLHTIISNQELNETYAQMLKFAMFYLKDPDNAEDAVQEAFYSALKNIEKFKGLSSFKTWIFAILKNKMVDILRNKKRYCVIADLTEEQDSRDFFDHEGHWHEHYIPQPFLKQEQHILSEQFWQIFHHCIETLPAKYGKIFMMREFLELSSEEICKEESISTTNLNVILYRARLKLQLCLSHKGLKD